MASKTVLICDRCGAENNPETHSFTFRVPPDANDKVPRQYLYSAELCPDCMGLMIESLVVTTIRDLRQRLNIIGPFWRIEDGRTQAEMDRSQEHAIAP